MFQVVPTEKGVDNRGSRASGFAENAMLTAEYREIPAYPLVSIGDTILTPFGDYVVNWHREGGYTNIDHLTLTQIE